MDRHLIDDDADLPPQDVWAGCLAGLDDIEHGRTETIDVVLASLDGKMVAWTAKQMAERDGDHSAQRSSSD